MQITDIPSRVRESLPPRLQRALAGHFEHRCMGPGEREDVADALLRILVTYDLHRWPVPDPILRLEQGYRRQVRFDRAWIGAEAAAAGPPPSVTEADATALRDLYVADLDAVYDSAARTGTLDGLWSSSAETICAAITSAHHLVAHWTLIAER